MPLMQLPQPQVFTYQALINDIEVGRIKIPQFQRDFVWTKEKSAHLLDSIIKGYPIGTLILWQTQERLRSIRNIGGAELPEPPVGQFVNYVLDGQQRLTSLFASIRGLLVEREGRVIDFSELYIDLCANEHERIVITDISERDQSEYIKIRNLIEFNFADIARYKNESIERMQRYRDRITGYNFSVISVPDAPIDIATEIFTRINEGGKQLSVFEIMVAKMFDASRNFDLSEKYDAFVDERLRDVGYETISSTTLLQLMAVLLTKTKECKGQQILNLNREEFIDAWPQAIDAFERAIDYFRTYFRIPVSRLLPYNALLIPFAYFFYHHRDRPIGDKQRYLTDFFWRISLSGRYASSLESKIAQDIKRIDVILDGKQPEYDFPVNCSPQFIRENGTFRTSSSYTKALLCLLVYFEPTSFRDNARILIDNTWLKQANSKNYHHFFPRAFLRRQGIDEVFANHIANITIVDDFLNKREISAQPPSQYMNIFRRANNNISETMRRHLIDADSESIKNDDYEAFINERCEWFSRELIARVIQQTIDQEKMTLPIEETEEIAA